MSASALLAELTRRGIALWIEGDRLRYRAARDVLTPDLLDAMQRHRDELVGLLGATQESPLSHGQKGIWFLCRQTPDSTAYDIAFACRIVSDLDVEALRGAFQAILDRHPSLRSTFGLRDDEPVQRIHARQPLAFAQVPATGWTEAELAAAVHEASREPHDLERGPLLRVRLFSTGRDHVLLLTMHHLVHDGWSLWGMLDELRELYAAPRGGRPATLPPLEASYRDFVTWQAGALAGEEARRSLEYWRGRLSGELPVLSLPTDRTRPAVRSDRGASLPFHLDAGLSARIRARAQAEGVTLYTLLLAAFQTLLHRYSGQTDLVVGSPIAGRNRVELTNVVGYFINQVALRADLSGDPPFRTFLAQVRERTLEAVEHGDYPFTLLVEQLQPARDPGRSPIFQVTFALQRPHRWEEAADLFVAAEMGLALEPGRRVRWGELTLEPYVLVQRRAWFDLTVQMMEVREVFAGSFSYSADLFDESTIGRMTRHFGTLLRAIADDPSIPLSRLPLLDADEARTLRTWHRLADADPPACLHRSFEAEAERRPDAVALIGEDAVLTYAELNARGNRLAHRLRRHHVGPESIVGVCVDRSPEMVVAILAVLKAGGAYLPLDPSYPRQRLELMLEDARVSVLITRKDLADRFPAAGPGRVALDVDDDLSGAESSANPASGAVSDDLAYVIYTSGSTGRPKGTLVSHANVARLFTATRAWARCDEADVWTLFHSAAFDFSVWEMWGALLHGGRVVVVPHATSRAPDEFLRLLEQHRVTVLNQTPTAFYQLASAAVRENRPAELDLRLVIFGGEALDPQRLRPWLAGFGDRVPRLVNMYGITETTVHVTVRPLTAADAEGRSSRIGVPIDDLATWIVDRHGALAPIGVPGEICVGGRGVARGYLGQPGLTADRFRPDPFADRHGARLYRSGDLARALPDRDIEYLGRTDQQVKVRGFRIEPGEIQAAFEEHAGVLASYVMARPDESGRLRLCAYVVPDATRALPVVRRLGLEKRQRLPAGWLHELPNGMAIAHLNRAETAFVYGEIFGRGAYLKHGIRIEDGDCVFDVGANIGLFPLFLRATGRRATVYAFEPIPPVFERLRANCELYAVDAELFECALGGEPGQARFTYYPNASVLSGRFADAGHEAELAKTYLLRGQPAGHGDDGVAEQLSELLAERLESREIACAVRTLSSVIAERNVARIALLKIDVEKAEMDVLAGIEPADWDRIEQVVVEVHDDGGRLREVERLLEAHGFRLTVEQDDLLAGTEIFSVYGVRRAPPVPPMDPVSRPVAELEWSSADRLLTDLRNHAKGRLPDYMMPAAYVLLDALPLTPNGKIDRRALPEPGDGTPASARGFVAPRTPAERVLAEIWARVLRLERVSVTDNFFELGGDSILSIAVATRAQDAGLRMISRQLFQHQTIAGLAAVLGAPAAARDAEPAAPVTGRVPLTPVQRWFVEQDLAAPGHFNQSVILELPACVEPARLAAALRDLVIRHDALRLCLARRDGRWEQTSVGPDVDVQLETIDLGELAEPARELEDVANRLQASFDLGRPPLLRAALVRAGVGRPDRVLLIAHHLAVDAVSWRIIADDLMDALGETAGASGRRRAGTTPFKEWAERLQRFVASPALDAEVDYWLAPARREVKSMPVDLVPGPGANVEASAATVVVSLDPAQTHALLHDVPVAHHTRINDVLLAALLRAYVSWTGHDRLLLDLEGHGREERFDGVDLTRSVGWFTTIFPVLLTAERGASSTTAAWLPSVREQLRAVPAQGLGYGVLRYLRDDPALAERLRRLPSPEIGFNYLGRLDAGLSGLVRGGTGRNSSPANRRPHLLDVNAFVEDDRLHVHWTYGRDVHRAATIERLAGSYRDALADLVAHRESAAVGARTPSDFPLAGLDAGALRKLSRLLEGKG